MRTGIVFFLILVVTLPFLFCSCEKKSSGLIECSGRIEGDESKVGTKISGKVTKLLVKEGDMVKKDQPVAELYSDQVLAAVEQLQAQFDAAQ